MKSLIVLLLALHGCAALEKDNEPKSPTPPLNEAVKARVEAYRPLIRAQLDGHGLVRQGGSIGDSALFSCLARVAGAADFDPAILLRATGQPVRHPDIAPGPPNAEGKRGTPVSRDMVSGILWCFLDLQREGQAAEALALVTKMIDFGKAHRLKFGTEVGWLFCTEEDRAAYAIKDDDWFGKCWMTPSIIKDTYRVAKLVGYQCDETCQAYMALGANVPANSTGFQRHLAVINTVRNGLVEGAINDNSLRLVLQKAAEEQPRNGLYVAAAALFGDGDQTAAWAALDDTKLFPPDALPTGANYCTEYLFQRDDDSGSGRDEPDWLPCKVPGPDSDGRGIEVVFAGALSLGEIR